MFYANDCTNFTLREMNGQPDCATVCMSPSHQYTRDIIAGFWMKKNVTIKDVARETGVHVSTVSRALSPNARSSLSDEVVTRIRKKAEEMGYRPNRVASGLRTKRTMSVGIMIPDIANALFPPIVRGVESVLEPAGYASILVNTDNDPARESRLFDVLMERGVDGIIDAAVHRLDPALVRRAKEVPIVTANRMVDGAGIPSVVNDDAGGVRMMAQKLYDAGHRNIAHIAGPQDLSTGTTRRSAFMTTMKNLGLDLKPGMIAAAERYTVDDGRRCARLLMEKQPETTAMLCANDLLAIGAIEAIRRAGLDCPTDISVTGFNDIPFLDLITPGLTTIQILQFDIGRIAAEILLKRLTDPDARVPETTIMPVSIVERGSVAPPRLRRGKRQQATG